MTTFMNFFAPKFSLTPREVIALNWVRVSTGERSLPTIAAANEYVNGLSNITALRVMKVVKTVLDSFGH